MLKPGTSVLHVAPEKNLRVWLSCNSAIHYICGDLEPSDPGMIPMDITNLPFEDGRFDVFICDHVLEHVIDDMQAMRELHRVLKVGGWGIVQVPIALNLESTYEDASVTSPEERQEVFGQRDHVRIYASDFTTRLKTAGFRVNIFNYGQKYGISEAEKWGLSANDNLYVVIK
ncbi:class I SAM-dependent methyltransferase [Paenibacillus sp. P26]|nr:class I SAM-dependent methyltransferase [Paenibacillus sp. P26]